jgi:hypothetical protein
MDFLAERGFMTNTSRASLAGLMCIAGGLLFTFYFIGINPLLIFPGAISLSDGLLSKPRQGTFTRAARRLGNILGFTRLCHLVRGAKWESPVDRGAASDQVACHFIGVIGDNK